MLGNSINGIMGRVIGAMLCQIYNFLYRPDSLVDTFTELDSYVLDIFNSGLVLNIYSVVKAIGIGMLVATFLVGLMDKVSGGDFTIQNFFVHLLKFFILYIALNYSMDILKYLMEITNDVFRSLNSVVTSDLTMQLGIEINKDYLVHGINRYINIIPKIAILMFSLIPYLVACLYSVVIYFFAISRVLELTVRVAMAPITVGFSYFSNGLQSDFVRYMKRTLALFFQIVIVFLISIGLSITHNALVEPDVTSSGEKIGNPALYLETNIDLREIDKGNDGTWETANPTQDLNDYRIAYTEDSIIQFTKEMLDFENLFVTMAIMAAGLFMVFKSKAISSEAFG